jgi:hypothetical protein
MCKEWTPETFTDSRRSLKVVEHLRGQGIVQRKAQKRNKTTEGFVKICHEGIERVQRVH